MIEFLCWLIVVFFSHNCITKPIQNLRNNKIITARYNKISDTYEVHMSIGEPFQRIYFIMSLSQKFSFTNSNLYHKRKSIYYSYHDQQEIKIDNVPFKAEQVSDNFEIYKANFVLENFHFFLLPENFNKKHSYLSFSYKNDNYHLNFIYELYKNHLIGQRNFAFSKIGPQDMGKLYLGGIPQEEINNKYKVSCNVNEGYSSWGCNINSILYQNESYPLDDYASFSVESEDVISSLNFYKILQETVFKQYIENKQCETLEKALYYGFNCKCEVAYNFSNITIVLDGIMFELDGNKLFHRLVNHCEFKIKSYKDSHKDWLIGFSFFNKYVTQFDFDRKMISFYSDYKIPFIENNRVLFKSYIYNTLALLSGIMSAWIIIYCLCNIKRYKVVNICYKI